MTLAPFAEYSKFFISLLAIIDPPAAIPVFLALTNHRTEAERRRDARVVSLAIVVILLVALYVGQYILKFFGISYGSFRVAGGLLLMLMSLEMMRQKGPVAFSDAATLRRSSDAVVPLAMPLMAGPGAISTVIVHGLRGETLLHYVALTACIVLLGVVAWVFLRAAAQWRARISDNAIAISNKIMSLIMAAVAVEFIANGIKQLFNLS